MLNIKNNIDEINFYVGLNRGIFIKLITIPLSSFMINI
jgi:hypothetical protein